MTKRPLIIAGNFFAALDYARRKGLKHPKIVTSVEGLYDIDGAFSDYALHIVYGGIDHELMRQVQARAAVMRQVQARTAVARKNRTNE